MSEDEEEAGEDALEGEDLGMHANTNTQMSCISILCIWDVCASIVSVSLIIADDEDGDDDDGDSNNDDNEEEEEEEEEDEEPPPKKSKACPMPESSQRSLCHHVDTLSQSCRQIRKLVPKFGTRVRTIWTSKLAMLSKTV